MLTISGKEFWGFYSAANLIIVFLIPPPQMSFHYIQILSSELCGRIVTFFSFHKLCYAE